MRCYSCSRFSVPVICKTCRENLFAPTMGTRKVGTLDVISFYKYSSLEALLHTKHKAEGYRIYKTLAKMTMKPFIEEFTEADDRMVYIIGIDEYVKSGYSHVALLTRAMKTKHSKPLHGALLAQNRVNYAGKSLQFRLENPRDFHYTGKAGIDVILVDDIITTGITLQEAQSVLLSYGVNVLFALTLADVQE
ncbi:MAG TPA: ComF family protein [Sulfurovum sp.]|nr:MAG: phosphoribosyltransferase [Sulfurovum sp. 35-42-20]OYY57535.1 MAG: phosphoribosyltransferase [Sulfurovum sp. 28-43-6]OYZ26103.1 MAG: phosphoribosyltransferase [Sulfurovum sp. 16-42-52]OYZ49140.1 MAG: phosphoribosyltransferase [Sulfurovum sp. 24-42-9]OZA46141.1 MAG: phosphoribosyltransferase [Sulfurovum sp. 17-42-90]OZA59211.1 MAG: phosphoribosyltransferase [Sulfurovum sp. 39-42-12]HQR74166.1 ComF family protein [Sulfurovum sp.]